MATLSSVKSALGITGTIFNIANVSAEGGQIIPTGSITVKFYSDKKLGTAS